MGIYNYVERGWSTLRLNTISLQKTQNMGLLLLRFALA